jgi:perosamine synthetase
MHWAEGPEIEEFEKTLAEYLGVDYCITMNSGTSALHATMIAHDIRKNDEILVPSFTFVSTANAALMVKAKPKFVDIETETYGMDPENLQKAITKKSKLIMPVHYSGLPCKIDKIRTIAKQNKQILIEDSAESLGATINSKKIGSFGDASIFSFAGNKVLTTGEGGAVVTNSKEIFEKLKLIRSHGRIDTKNYFENPQIENYEILGYNWRMSTITAALGISQIQKLDRLIKLRKENAKYITERISKFQEITPPNVPKGHEHIYQMYTIRLKNQKLRDSLHDFLIKKQIFSKIYFSPIHTTSFYKRKFPTDNTLLPITEKISEEVLTLPMYPNMTNEEKNFLIDSISEFFEKE